MRRRILGVVVPVAVAAVAVAGRGGSSSSTTTKLATKSGTVSTSGAHAVALSAALEGMLKFDTTTLSAKAGTVTNGVISSMFAASGGAPTTSQPRRRRCR
jgi:hypothetical protein